jgi:hypothetical protein
MEMAAKPESPQIYLLEREDSFSIDQCVLSFGFILKATDLSALG